MHGISDEKAGALDGVQESAVGRGFWLKFVNDLSAADENFAKNRIG